MGRRLPVFDLGADLLDLIRFYGVTAVYGHDEMVMIPRGRRKSCLILLLTGGHAQHSCEMVSPTRCSVQNMFTLYCVALNQSSCKKDIFALPCSGRHWLAWGGPSLKLQAQIGHSNFYFSLEKPPLIQKLTVTSTLLVLFFRTIKSTSRPSSHANP